MKLLIVTGTDSRSFSLAEILTDHHEVSVLHTMKLDFDCPFSESILDDTRLDQYALEEYQFVIYFVSDNFPCKYLTFLLQALEKVPRTNGIIIEEHSLNLSAPEKKKTEWFICEGFRTVLKDRISYWHTVPIYGNDFLPGELTGLLREQERKNRFLLPGGQSDEFEAIHVADLASAIEKYTEKGITAGELFLSPHQQSTIDELGKALHEIYPLAEIGYSGTVCPKQMVLQAECLEGWAPGHRFFDELPAVIRKIEEERTESFSEGTKSRVRSLFRLVIFVVLFFAVCVYTSFVRVSSELQFVDFRLLFIIASCLFFGRRYGLAGAVLCSAESILQSILGGTKWHVIFFHIDNWIPVAIYLASAVLFGMYHDTRGNRGLKDSE